MSYRTALMRGVAAIAAIALDGSAASAFAQAAPGASASDAATTIGEVVVTARRREEALQEVPVAVTAFSQTMLTEKAIASAFDLSRSVPGLAVTAGSANPAITIFSIRGRGQNYGAAAGSVETYLADVPLSAPFQEPTLPPQFFDLQSFQVLKGPQGTLFGRNTTGGAIVIVPQAPTDQFGGYLRVQGGNYGDFQAEGAVNIPIAGDKVDLRVAGFRWSRDGYMHTFAGTQTALSQVTHSTPVILPSQTYDNVDETELRATLRVRPFEGFENSTILTYHTDKTRSSSGAGLNRLGLGPSNGLGVFETPGYFTRWSNSDVDLNKGSEEMWALINTTTYELNSNLTFKNIFGYINSTGFGNDAADADGSAVLPVSIDLLAPQRKKRNWQTTDEVQVQGKNFDNRFTWVVGGLIDETREPGEADTMNVANQTINFGSYTTTFEQNTYTSIGIYGSGTLALTDKLNLSAGYRHSFDNIRYGETQQIGGNPVILVPINRYHQRFQGDTYNVDIDYHPTSASMIYGGFRRGYKRGGFNESQTNPLYASFGPETVDDFYLGLKDTGHIAGMPYRFNIEGYYDLYKGMQVSFLSSNGVNLTTITTNIPKTTFRGFDLDTALDPTSWLTLNLLYSFTDAFNTQWPDNTSLVPGLTQDLTVNPVPSVSRNKVSFTARLHHELDGNRGELVLAPTVNYQSLLYTTPVAVLLPLGEQQVLGGNFDMASHGAAIIPAYATVDLRAEWNHIMGSRIDGALNVTNATNKFYKLGTSGTLNFGIEGFAYGPPRMVNVELSTRF